MVVVKHMYDFGTSISLDVIIHPEHEQIRHLMLGPSMCSSCNATFSVPLCVCVCVCAPYAPYASPVCRCVPLCAAVSSPTPPSRRPTFMFCRHVGAVDMKEGTECTALAGQRI